MRVIFCIKQLSGISGGAEWVLTTVANGLSDRGFDVYVISFDDEGVTNFFDFLPSVKCIRMGSCTNGFINKFKFFLRMKRAVKALKPSIVFGFMPSVYVVLSVIFYFNKFKFVACEHITREWYRGHLLKYILVSVAGNLACRISFLSCEIADGYGLIASKQKLIIANPVRKISKIANVMAPSKTNFVILNVGRLVEFKDQRTLVEAFSLIHGDFPKWRLKIIGEGVLGNDLSLQVRDLGLSDVVEILAKADNIEEEYANSDLFVISSRFEGFGLVTAEASSAGLPCVGFLDCEGTNKIIKDGFNGQLVDPSEGRVEALAECLRALMNDRKKMRYLGKNGLSRSPSYELQSVIDRWEKVIKMVVCNNKKYINL